MIVWLYPTLLAVFFAIVAAETPIDLGAAGSFVILAGAAITTSEAAVVMGDIGSFPTPAITLTAPTTFIGNIDNVLAATAQQDLLMAINIAKRKVSTETLTGRDLGGMTLPPGVYKFAAIAPLNGILTLDAQGDANAVWVFQIGSALNVGIGSSVVFKDRIGSKEFVYWQVGSSATFLPRSSMIGNIMASVSITLGTAAFPGATIYGRLLCTTAVTIVGGGVGGALPAPAVTKAPTAIATTVPTIAATSFPTAVPRTSAPSLKKKKDCKSKAPTAVTNNYLDLGDAALFAILAGTQVNTDGSCVITGDIGVFPGSTVTGIPSSSAWAILSTCTGRWALPPPSARELRSSATFSPTPLSPLTLERR
ncbi:hypothetical protein B484DRAFT_276682 [Ochromonadaceae sp. CCMP2298]|nr:hypothetical protein B484DRAFT_276682 [Ochromonadaceae sp. CCMP2298]